MRRTVWIAFLIAACAAPAQPSTRAPAPVPRALLQAEIEVLRGTVEVRTKGATAWVPIVHAGVVPVGADVRTSAQSVAELRFPDGSVARLAPDSHIAVELYPQQSPEHVTDLALYGGEVWSTVVKLADGPREYRVRTDNALALVRGTSFDMSYVAGKSRVVVSEHEVEVLMSGRSVRLERARALYVTDDAVEEGSAEEFFDGDWFQSNIASDLEHFEELATDPDIEAFYEDDFIEELDAFEQGYVEVIEEYDYVEPEQGDAFDTLEWELWVPEDDVETFEGSTADDAPIYEEPTADEPPPEEPVYEDPPIEEPIYEEPPPVEDPPPAEEPPVV